MNYFTKEDLEIIRFYLQKEMPTPPESHINLLLKIQSMIERYCEHDKRIKNLQELIDIQSMNGNYNFDPYMHGLANGLLLAMSCFTDKEPEFLKAPIKWINE